MATPERAPDPADPTRGGSAFARLAAQREHSLMALVELGRALDLRLAEPELARLALYNLVGHFGAPHAGLWLRPQGGGPLAPTALVGMTPETCRELAAALETMPAVWPAGEIVRLFSADWLGNTGQLARRAGLSALARLEGQDDWLGYVALAAPRSRPFFGTADGELLAASLGIVAAAIENQRLLHDLHRGTERLEAANRRMQELDRLRSEMLQNLNHEFRTPIAAILGAASCLREPGLQEGHRQQFLGMIERQAGNARDMITMLLDHAELMSIRATIQCAPTDIGACIRATVAARAGQLAAAKSDVQLDLAADSLHAQADADHLRRVLDELITNACKFSPAGSAVSIRAERRANEAGEAVVVEVADRGRGMTAGELAVAFEPFRQADGSSTRTAGGLGVGLASARRAMELMGGSIALESEPGRGTTARLELRAA